MFLNRLYFRKDTGEFIHRTYLNDHGTGGIAKLPTVEEDFASISSLNQYVLDAVIYLELEEGEYEDDLQLSISVRLNLETMELEFVYPSDDPEPIYTEPLTKKVEELQQENVRLNEDMGNLLFQSAEDKMTISTMEETMGNLLIESAADKATIMGLEETMGNLLFEVAALKGGAA
ncbi:hypothetical protein ACFQ3J_08720 [Paenibacillus provencensis]|uniref:Uncharacterized protein n=1 Tax=Paenibacillus provencensis TaxID=441151 RepID=A0ABW3PPV3_9BACL|nr:hypothetical protein [Paenibacillus sp. MER 78]MCM3129028.1 hypothetical protein [Paenibacillus sp. MER 78]